MFKQKIVPVLLAATAALLTGCRIIQVGVLAAAGAVGLAGYAVYKAGDSAVTGTGKAAHAAGKTLTSGTQSAVTVIFSTGELKTGYDCDVQTLWDAARRALQKARFEKIRGSFDAKSGELTAKTLNDTDIVIRLKSSGAQSTEACIRIGAPGDLQRAEVIHGFILRELSSAVLPSSDQEIKS